MLLMPWPAIVKNRLVWGYSQSSGFIRYNYAGSLPQFLRPPGLLRRHQIAMKVLRILTSVVVLIAIAIPASAAHRGGGGGGPRGGHVAAFSGPRGGHAVAFAGPRGGRAVAFAAPRPVRLAPVGARHVVVASRGVGRSAVVAGPRVARLAPVGARNVVVTNPRTGRNVAIAGVRAGRLAPIGERGVRGAAWGRQHGWYHQGRYWYHNHNRTNFVYIAGVYPWDSYGWDYPGWAYNDYPDYWGYGGYGYTAPTAGIPAVGESLAVEVQRALQQSGYYNGPIDGIIGSGSRAAIRAYQAANGLPVTGGIDSGLLSSLGL